MGSGTTNASSVLGTTAGGQRVLLVDLEGPGAGERLDSLARAIASAPDLARSAARSGPGLALAAHVSARRAAHAAALEPAFAISVGDAVRRGVPTAARATISAVAPLRLGLAEAQFGGRFGASLAQVAHMLVVVGRAPQPVVLEVRQDGGVGVVLAQEALGEQFEAMTTRERARTLSTRGCGAHVLTTGAGADVGLPFANLASFDGDDVDGAPSIVGRGGLGATVAAAGVVGLSIESAASPGPERAPDALRDLLLISPRLLARSVGGTLELGPLREGEVDLGTASREKHGCRGCPTPCGWRFDVKVRGGGSRVSGRFAALQGFVGHGDVLALVQHCNDLGVDARSVAALFARVPRDVDPDAFLSAIVVRGSGSHRDALAVGSTPGIEPEPGATFASADLAARVGQALAARGPEPVRSLSVLGLAGVEPAALVAPLVWSGERETDAGTLAYWHECFAAAIDITGFCAFSAAALLADGLADVARLEEVLRPGGAQGAGWGDGPAEGDGRALLAAGAEHVALHRELCGPGGDPRSVQIEEELPAAVGAYRRAVRRGFVGEVEPVGVLDSDPATVTSESEAGTIRVRATGILAARLASFAGQESARPVASASGDGLVVIEIDVPLAGWTVVELLGSLAAAHPPAARWLLDPRGLPVPAVVVDERRIAAGESICAGAVAELVLAIPGG